MSCPLLLAWTCGRSSHCPPLVLAEQCTCLPQDISCPGQRRTLQLEEIKGARESHIHSESRLMLRWYMSVQIALLLMLPACC